MRLVRIACYLSLVLAALPAFAANHVITALPTPNRFEPPTLEISAGDTVTFVNGGVFHNVKSDSGAVTAFRCANGCDGVAGGNGNVAAGWSATVAFPAAGTAGFHCEAHGGDGIGMHGTITVVNGTPSTKNHRVWVVNNRFEPPSLEIRKGDSVTFVNREGTHNVTSDAGAVTAFTCANGCNATGGSGSPSSSAWMATVAFPTAGVAGYYCQPHGGEGIGQHGTITIVDGTPATTNHAVTASATNTFDPGTLAIKTGDSVTFLNGGGSHNVTSDPGAVTAFRCANGCDATGGDGSVSSGNWAATVVFPTAGTAGYYCQPHGSPGAGSFGTITVIPADRIFANGFE